MNKKLVIRLLGALLLIEAACMVPSLLIALIYRDPEDAPAIVWSILLMLAFGLPMHLLPRGDTAQNLHAKDGFAVVGLGWIMMSVFGGLPFYFSHLLPTFVDAVFESVSGFTTTGASVLTDFERPLHGVIFWRSFTHWIGGMGVLVLTLALVPKLTGRTAYLVKAESPGPSLSKIAPKLADSSKILYIIYTVLTLLMFIVPVLLVGLSVFMAVFFNKIFPQREKTAAIAHRTGGYLASENSLEGLDEAESHGCYGSETDVQRTLDGHYVINHDTDFARLTGEKRKPSEMTLEEIMDLKIRDTTGHGGLLSVPTLEEMPDHSKGKVKLFLELKGETADRDMADDGVKAVKERDMVDEVALISLDYDVIDYAEQMYPEMETSVLIFGAVGDVTNLNCDMIIMEEEMASVASTVRKIHDAGKKAGVWTVNTERAMRKFLDSEADMVITDDILMANEVQKELDERADYDILKDRSPDLWFY